MNSSLKIHIDSLTTALIDGNNAYSLGHSGEHWKALEEVAIRESPVLPQWVRYVEAVDDNAIVAVMEVPAGVYCTTWVSDVHSQDIYSTRHLALPYTIVLIPFTICPVAMLHEGFIKAFWAKSPLTSLDNPVSQCLLGNVMRDGDVIPNYFCLGHDFFQTHLNLHVNQSYISKTLQLVVEKILHTSFHAQAWAYQLFSAQFDLSLPRWEARTKENPRFILNIDLPGISSPTVRGQIEKIFHGSPRFERNAKFLSREYFPSRLSSQGVLQFGSNFVINHGDKK